MPHILSIQSHVAFGHAGNAAAVFPMQRLGCQVTAIHLLHYSNHLGYPGVQGEVLSSQQLESLIQGLEEIGALATVDAIVTGFIASAGQADYLAGFIQQMKARFPGLLYCCDPVMGDFQLGQYVDNEIATIIKRRLVPLADIITPNGFECHYLAHEAISNQTVTSVDLQRLHQQHQMVLVTSYQEQANQTGMLLLSKQGCFQITTPKYALARTVVGSGDVTTACFVGHYLKTKDPGLAFERTANIMHTLAQYTYEHQLAELAIVACQDSMVNPERIFIKQPYQLLAR